LRLVEVAVVDDPAPDARVVHLGQFSQGLVAAVMQRPAPDFPADARQRLRAGGGLETVREDAPVRLPPHDLSGSKLEAEKVKVYVGNVAPPVHILTIDNLRLLRMQHQLAGREAVGNRAPERPRLLGALAVSRPRTARTECARTFAPSTRRTRNAGIGLPAGARPPPPVAFPPCAERRYHPPSSLAPSTSVRRRAAPTDSPCDNGRP